MHRAHHLGTLDEQAVFPLGCVPREGPGRLLERITFAVTKTVIASPNRYWILRIGVLGGSFTSL